MSHTIRKDIHGLFVRCNGQIFRPLFPNDYPKHSNKTRFAEGAKVKCEHHIATPLCVVATPRLTGGWSETWFSHGTYMQPRAYYKKTAECYKPHGFSWPGGFGDKVSA